ncbi:MAG: glycosyltransferase family 4 protein [Gallionellaceae bacterium]|nr:glycosyltransferase family 4 protein [Gallionellaceae bacterium]
MKVLLISGSYPPDKCGVGDYTAQLAEALASRGNINVGVLTGIGADLPIKTTQVNVFRSVSKWRNSSLAKIRRIVLEFQPDVVHIQYPTQAYQGRPPRFLPLLLRLMGLPVVQTWHEYYHESGVSWHNLLACDALVYVRPDFKQKIPRWVSKCLFNTPVVYVPNVSSIPVVSLSAEQARAIKLDLSNGKPVVCFFGFAHINKGLEHIFSIADPAKHHLVLICDLSDQDPYQANILNLANQTEWIGRVTVTGFQTSQRVGEILAVADSVVFPFPNGAGEWNTSLKASEASGAFTLATTQDETLLGYHENTNTYFAGCGQITDMRNALNKYLGRRNKANTENAWEKSAMEHVQIYEQLIR